MKLENITDVFFDLDHTLWDFEKNSAVAFQTIFKNHQMLYALDDFLMVYPEINQKYWESYRMDKITHDQLRYLRLKESFDKLGIVISDEDIYKIATAYIDLLPLSNHLIKDARNTLEYLAKKYNLHIITNGLHQIQKRKIDNSNISSFFKTITDSDSVGVKKPNPKIFEYALKVAGCDAQNGVMIGDCIEADVQGAINVGMQAILFNETIGNNKQNINIIHNLDQLKKIL
jgi:YjjG family noncanonical pyrimidine nucleotidase